MKTSIYEHLPLITRFLETGEQIPPDYLPVIDDVLRAIADPTFRWSVRHPYVVCRSSDGIRFGIYDGGERPVDPSTVRSAEIDRRLRLITLHLNGGKTATFSVPKQWLTTDFESLKS